MKSTTSWVSFLVIIAAISNKCGADQCPFNEQQCSCKSPDPPVPYTYHIVECTSTDGSPISFTASPGVTYEIDNMYLSGNMAYLPARYLAIFHRIDSLNLTQLNPDSPPVPQWDENAFDGPSITTLATTNLNGVLPPQPALNKLASAGLQGLTITNGNIQLNNNGFQNFAKLSFLHINDAKISQLETNAFAGLEQSLTFIYFRNWTGSFGDFSLDTLGQLTSLTYINLNSVGLKTIPAKFFLAFPRLTSLALSTDDLASAIVGGALDSLPPWVTLLQLSYVHLTSVPKQILINHPQLTFFDLYGNDIQSVSPSDFKLVAICSTLACARTPYRALIWTRLEARIC